MGLVDVPMPEERRWYRDSVNWLTIAVLVGFAVAVFTSPTFQSWLHSLWSSQPQQLQQPRLCSVLIEADVANATALVNGTLHALPARLSVREGSTLVIEPQPTVTHEPLNSSVTVKVTGNATVALRYRRVYALVRVSVFGAGQLIVNGTPVGNATLKVRPGTLLVVLVAPGATSEAEVYVNGSRLSLCASCAPRPLVPLEVRGDTELSARFSARRIVLRIDTGGMPAFVKGRGFEQWVNGTATFSVFAGDAVNLTTLAQRSGGGFRCVTYWRMLQDTPSGRLEVPLPPNGTAAPLYDAELRAVVGDCYLNYPPPFRGAVLANGSEVPAEMIPLASAWRHLKPWTMNISYLGNGTWLLDEPSMGSVVLDVGANWSVAVVDIWVEQVYQNLRPVVDVSIFYNPSNYTAVQYPSVSSGYYRVVFTRDGTFLEVPEGWVKGAGWAMIQMPELAAGRVKFFVISVRVRVRVEVKP